MKKKGNVSRETEKNRLFDEEFYKKYEFYLSGGVSRSESFYNALYFNTVEKRDAEKAATRALPAAEKGKFRSSLLYRKTIGRIDTPLERYNSLISLLLVLPHVKRWFSGFGKTSDKAIRLVAEIFDDAERLGKACGRWLFRHAFGIFSVLLVLLFALQVNFCLGKSVALELYVDGERMGYVRSAQAYFAALDAAEDNLSNLLGMNYQIPDGTSSYRLELVSDPEYLSETDVIKALTASSNKYLSLGYGLYVDDSLVAVGGSRMIMDRILEETLEAYRQLYSGTAKADRIVSFSNSIKIKEITVPKTLIKGEAEIRQILGLDEYGSVGRLLLTDKSNPELHLDEITEQQISAELPENSVLYVDSASSTEVVSDTKKDTGLAGKEKGEDAHVLAIKTVQTRTYNEIMPCEVQYVYDGEMMEGRRIVSTYGYDGLKRVTYDIYYDADGREVDREVVSETVIYRSSPKIVKVGTRPISELKEGATVTGTYIMPYDGYITSYFSGRTLFGAYEFHGAIDIYGPYGANIVASDGGQVVFAGPRGTYGNCVIIDHGDGIETLYAHLSSFAVQEGDYVGQGWKIGEMGETGRTTGVHVHFEVRENGVRRDPMKYVN